MNKYIKLFKDKIKKFEEENNINLDEDTLKEAKQIGILYHNTPNLYSILKENKLEGNFSIGLSFDRHEGWFNDEGWHNNSYYTLMLDGNRLSENYKLIETDRSKGEILAIPPHQEIKTYKKELDKVINDLKKYSKATDEDIKKYIYFRNPNNINKYNEEEKKFIKYFQEKYFNLEYPRNAEDLGKLDKLIYYYSQTIDDPYEADLETPLVINNLNKYLVGLIVRYPLKSEVTFLKKDTFEFKIDNNYLSNIINNINRNIKMFKGMYPNLPVYLRDENGNKAVIKNKQINKLPDIKAAEYKSRRIK